MKIGEAFKGRQWPGGPELWFSECPSNSKREEHDIKLSIYLESTPGYEMEQI